MTYHTIGSYKCQLLDNSNFYKQKTMNMSSKIILRKIERGILNLATRSYDVATIGSQSRKDIDLVIIDRNSSYQDSFISVSNFGDMLINLTYNLKCNVIVKHEHRSFVNSREPLLHLLFYPSYDHLVAWETPSFISSLYNTGNYISGSRIAISEYNKNYYSRCLHPFSRNDIVQLHFFRYADLALTTFIYSTLQSDIYSEDVCFENLAYVFRFSIIELLIDKDPTIKEAIWSWNGLIKYLCDYFPDEKGIISLLNLASRNSYLSSYQEIRHCLLEYFKLFDKRLSAMGSMNIPIM